MPKLLRKVYNVEFYDDGTYKYDTNFNSMFMHHKASSVIIKMNIGLDHDIDVECFKKALECIKKRYPYYFGRVRKEGNRYFVVGPLDAPIVLYENKEISLLGTEETNYYHIAFTYNKDKFCMYFSHGLMDGRNYMKVVKTLFYYYYTYKYEKDGINKKVIVNQYVETSTPLNMEKDHANAFAQVGIAYEPSYENILLSELGPIYRSKLKESLNTDTIKAYSYEHVLLDTVFKICPSFINSFISFFLFKILIFITMIGSVSYVGKNDFGTLNDCIKLMYTEMNTSAAYFMLEVDNAGGYLYLSFMNYLEPKENDREKYVNKFIELMEKDGIKCEVISKQEFIKTKAVYA